MSGSDRRSKCPLNVSVEIFGDHWSLLLIRDLMLHGAHSFKDLKCADEGIATNILTDRLERLTAQGVIEKIRSTTDHRRFIYRLTEKGIDLAPVILEMIVWGARYEETDAPPAAIEEMEMRRDDYLSSVRKVWAENRVDSDDDAV